MMILVIEIKLD